jgi:GT2 family glycosyltransferase
LKVSIITAVHEKPLETWQKALASLAMQGADQIVIVHDRAPEALVEASKAIPDAVVVDLTGPKGWRSPCLSFNAGLERATGDVVLVSHSDIIQAPGNVERIRAHFSEHPDSVLFGMVVESNPEKLTGAGNAGPLLMGTGNPRPLAWSMAAKAESLRNVNGWDLAYMEGVCYEDDDLTARLWKSGLDLYFNDDCLAIHETHERGYFNVIKELPNRSLFINRYGCKSAGDYVRRSKPVAVASPGRLAWKHV